MKKLCAISLLTFALVWSVSFVWSASPFKLVHTQTICSCPVLPPVSVTLSNDQFKALPNTPLEIVPSPGPGKALRLISGAAVLHSSAGVYTNLDFSLIRRGLVLMTTNSNIQVSAYTGSNGAISNYPDVVIEFVPFVNYINIGSSDGVLSQIGRIVDYENDGFSLALLNGTLGNLMGGDPSNTLKVTVYYVVVDV